MNSVTTAQTHAHKQPLPIKTLTFILCLLVSCYYTGSLVVQQHWQLPLTDLLQSSENLPLKALASQMTIIPTMLVAVCAGGILGLVSILLQQLVKNNLASDTTLAVGSGAQIALLNATLFFPSIGAFGSFWVAFVGALLSISLVFMLAMPSKMNPLVLVLGGLIINILLTAISGVLLIFNTEQALNVMAWGGGNVLQTSWQASKVLGIASLCMAVLMLPLLKPLTLMSLDDSQAQRLGVAVNNIRMLIIVTIALVTALVVSHVGILSFIGLGAATLVNALQIRTLAWRMLLSFVLGGLLLLVTSNIATLLAPLSPIFIPAGALSGILGAPLIIWLILRQKKQITEEVSPSFSVMRKPIKWAMWLISLFVIFVVLQLIAPVFSEGNNQSSHQVLWSISLDWHLISQYRLPRSIGAIATGIMLACAGVLIQTLTRNPMASPEVLGISSGAALGVLLSFLLLPMVGVATGILSMLISGTLGALLVLVLLLWLSKSVNVSYLLLIGIGLSALMTGILNIIQLSGDPRLQAILSWLSGTSYAIRPQTSLWLIIIATVLFITSLLLIKPLNVIKLGDTVAHNLGVNIRAIQILIMFVIAALSATATLAVGPLSFIGLMTPHLATSLGAVQLHKQLILSAILGAGLMLLADWIGRYAIFPYEIPAGTIASIIGGVYFVYLMRKLH